MGQKRIVLYILYALLAAVCFVVWDTWQKDYPPAVATAVTPAITSPALTTTPQANSASSTVIAAADTTTATPIPENRLLKIHTDVLDVAIDTLGGAVVQAKLLQYHAKVKQPAPVQLFNDDQDKFYVAKSALYLNAADAMAQKPLQYKVTQHEYSLEPEQKTLQATLQQNNKGIIVNKIFTFTRGHYDIKVDYVVNNKSKETINGFFQAELQRKNVKEAETGSKLQYGTFAGAAFSSPAKLYEKVDYKKLAKENINRDVQGGWMALQQHYFLSAWIPDKSATYNYSSTVAPGEVYTIKLVDNKVQIPAGATTNVNATLYVGPELPEVLKSIAPGLDLTIDYGWLWFISVFLFWVMQQLQRVIGNWGWTIIAVTVLIKAVFFKLSEVSYRSMAKMKDLAPKLQAIKERCGTDRQKLSQATMELYRKEKVNPMSGCLPMIVQIPVFIGLYYVLIEAVQLRHAPFIFWLHDLSTKDPYYILPILMGISMLIQQLLSPQSPDPMQSKMMMALPVVFTVFFLNFPSGLVLYWLVNNVLSIAQQWYINKKYTHPSAAAPSLMSSLLKRAQGISRKK